MKNSTIVHLAKLLVIGMLIQLFVIGFVWYSNWQGRVRTAEAQQAGCERSKLDRIDSARFQNAHTMYIGKVTSAKSVQEDVKRAAREARKTFRQTSTSLTQRATINCKEAFPKASLFP